MSSSQARKALQDVIPNYLGEFTPKLLDYINSLYQLSLRKQAILPNKSEIARFHLCAVVIVEKYKQSFELPTPDVSRIPTQPKIAAKLLDTFRELIEQISAASTPVSSPKKVKPPSQSPLTPTKSRTSKENLKSGSPLKRLRAEMLQEDQVNGNSPDGQLKDVDSPFNPKKRKESKAGTPTHKVYKYDKKHVLIADFIAFCNTFLIPGDITAKMVGTFLTHQHKFLKKSDWSLACGMVYAAYIRINNRLLAQLVGTKSEFTKQLLQYQKGGLLLGAMQSWCGIIEEWIQDEPWIQEIEKTYAYGSKTAEETRNSFERKAKIGEGWDLMEQFGAMIHGETISLSSHQEEYYKNWRKEALEKCDQL